MTKFRIGRHINISKGLITAPQYAHSIGCNIMQIFLAAPRQIHTKPHSKKELMLLAKELEKYKLKMVIHASYTINLAHPKKNKLYQTSVKATIQDLEASQIIGDRCLGVIIHMGKNIEANGISTDKAIANYVRGIKEILAVTSANLILETGASQGTEVGSELEGLSQIYWMLTKKEQERIQFCIDTCHIWATGYNISTKAGVKKFFKEFDQLIGIDKISCIHFNDSKSALESCVDRHADIGEGYIGLTGLKEVALFAQKHKIPLIFETPLDTINPKTKQNITFTTEKSKVKKWLK